MRCRAGVLLYRYFDGWDFGLQLKLIRNGMRSKLYGEIPVIFHLRPMAMRRWMSAGIVNLFVLMQSQGKGEAVSPLYSLQAARAGVVISCQNWNCIRSS